MGPESPLPIPPSFSDADSYVESLFHFGTSSQILHTLCGGVHILDFLTKTPDLYSIVVPSSWRAWFALVDVQDVLDLLLREELGQFNATSNAEGKWRSYTLPPSSLVAYISNVRRHLLSRSFKPAMSESSEKKSSRNIFMGMNPKKIHEVDNFARYMERLACDIEKDMGEMITHLADFGAGQNYLGRVLASSPYNRRIIAIESRPHVVEGARNLDIHAKIAAKPVVRRNKKAYRAAKMEQGKQLEINGVKTTQDTSSLNDSGDVRENTMVITEMNLNSDSPASKVPASAEDVTQVYKPSGTETTIETLKSGQGTIQYIEHRISDGNLASVIEHIVTPAPSSCVQQQAPSVDDSTSDNTVLLSNGLPLAATTSNNSTHPPEPSLMVISLHSCGNLVHHGLRTLTINPAVKAVALIGCCYNLMTERLGPPTHKMPLRPGHPRLDATVGARDPHGFPMSEQFAKYKHWAIRPSDFSSENNDGCACPEPEIGPGTTSDDMEEGIRWNITARMMAVQAPQNWTEAESSSFFTRHFFRALLQRIFLDKGVVDAPPSNSDDDMGCSPAGSSWGFTNGEGIGMAPVVIGNLRKKCYESFTSYVRGAVEKLLIGGGEIAQIIEKKVGGMSDAEIQKYETEYQTRKKELSIIWSLMAFSAGVVEAMIVVDRWLWLKEQPSVKHAWVEPVFDYALSPRNLAIVGIK